MTVGSLAIKNVVTIDKEASVKEAAHLMRVHHVGCVVVVDQSKKNEKPIGILSDRDIIIEIVALGENPGNFIVNDIMVRNPIVVVESRGIKETIRIMKENGIRRIPVVAKMGQLCGIVTEDDILSMLSDEISELSFIYQRQIQKEANGESLINRFF